LKYLVYLFVIALSFASCKPTSNIVTSKYEAQKRGIYQAPENRRVASKPAPKAILKTTSARSNSTDTYTASNSPGTYSEARRAETKKSERRRNVVDRNEDDYVINADNASYMVKQLINVASENLGADYRSGGTTPDGFDCSGLMYSTFQKFDITLPRSSNDMAKIGRRLDNDEIRKGDLIFFKTNGRSVINHVGMVTEVSDDEIKFIHSSTQKGVIISSTKEAYYGRTFAQANRILE
jgi:murein DD-endopeptidase / murein LD-carboxypeptidase